MAMVGPSGAVFVVFFSPFSALVHSRTSDSHVKFLATDEICLNFGNGEERLCVRRVNVRIYSGELKSCVEGQTPFKLRSVNVSP